MKHSSWYLTNSIWFALIGAAAYTQHWLFVGGAGLFAFFLAVLTLFLLLAPDELLDKAIIKHTPPRWVEQVFDAAVFAVMLVGGLYWSAFWYLLHILMLVSVNNRLDVYRAAKKVA